MLKIGNSEQLQKWINWKMLIQQYPNDFFPNNTEETLEMYIHNLIQNVFYINSNCGLEVYLNHVFEHSIDMYSESPTKNIYPYINSKKAIHIERRIRDNINRSWDKIPEQTKENVFPYLIPKKVPPNLYYIVSLYEYISGHFYQISEEDTKQIELFIKQNPILMNSATIPKEYDDFKLRFFVRKLMYEQYQDYNTFAYIGAKNIFDTILSYVTGTAISDNIQNQIKYLKYIKGLLPKYPYPTILGEDPIASERNFIKRTLQKITDYKKQQIFNTSFLSCNTYIECYVSNMVNYIQKVYHK